jgi:hybrid cluster-associated redox disulfide protein
MKKVTKQTIIGDILDAAPDTAVFFLEIGMHCLGCPASRNETVEMACMVHNENVDDLVKKLNEMIAANKK